MISTRKLSITRLYQDNFEKLRLAWVAACGVEREVELREMEVYGPDVVGHLNLVYGHRIQVIGRAEQSWAARVGEEHWRRRIDEVMSYAPPAVILADDLESMPGLRECCEATGTPLFTSPKACSVVIDLLHLYLARHFADMVSMHGVFLDVFGMGVLIT
ncbi:MAG: HPr kinase/phosphorylase, partial [Candidatus Accumulibacter sp.]|nr:HPr kinase/phosphorylase [Accumulibacter sp.]